MPEHGNLWDMSGYPALQAWFGCMKSVPYYEVINVVNVELGDLTNDVSMLKIAEANKRGIKAIVGAAAVLPSKAASKL